VTVLVDTSLLLDYLNGDKRAGQALKPHLHRAISVVTWLEIMTIAPLDKLEETRGFLRSFERLSISEAIADEAHRLVSEHGDLAFHRAITWATARVNQLPLLTVDAPPARLEGLKIEAPYRWPHGQARA
jgi:predicted nucleic acid-binding protein